MGKKEKKSIRKEQRQSPQQRAIEQAVQPEQVSIAAIQKAESSLAVIERAEIEALVNIAKQHPRSLTEFIRSATEMISLDEETALSCIYRRPVGSDEEGGGQKIVEGQSIRFAEIVHSTYGNLWVSDIDAEIGVRSVKSIGFAIDLQTLSAARRVVVESTVKKNGVPYTERMRVVAAKAAAAKARRDAILSVVPKGILKQLYNTARQVAFGKGDKMTLAKRRTNLLEWLAKIGVEKERMFAVVKVKGVDDIGIDELEILIGLKTAIADGDVTVEEAFPPIEGDVAETQKGVAGLKEKIKKSRGQKPPISGPTDDNVAGTKAPMVNEGDRQRSHEAAEKLRQDLQRKSKIIVGYHCKPCIKDFKPEEVEKRPNGEYTCPECGEWVTPIYEE